MADGLLWRLFGCFAEIFLFWLRVCYSFCYYNGYIGTGLPLTPMLQRLFAWWTQKSPRDLLLETIADARRFEEWNAAGKHSTAAP